MAGKFSIVLEYECRAPLERLAKSLGYVWGAGGNVKAMVQAIAQQQLLVVGSTAFAHDQRLAVERLPSTIEIQKIYEWEGSDLLGYYCLGHQDAIAFAEAVNAEHEPDDPVDASQVRREYWVERPDPDAEYDPETFYESCAQDADGAFAVTHIKLGK